MFKYSLGIALIIAMVFSCKKKDNSASQSNNNTASTGGTTTGTPTGSGTLSPSTGGDFCSLQTTYSYLDYNGTVTKDSSVFATFYATPPTSVAPTNVFGGTVTLNNTVIPFSSSTNSYYNSITSPVNIAGQLTWSVSGSGTVTAFSQVYTPNYPKYTGGNLLPDTCTKASGITINISGVSNVQNGVTVYIFGSATAYKYLFGTSGSVTFTPADLANFSVNQSITIMVGLGNFYSATIGGIKRGFSNTVNYQKASYLK